MKVYLSGPMTGYPGHNYKRFNELSTKLRKLGHEVLNPAELDGGDTHKTYAYYIRRDISLMIKHTDLQAVVVHGRWWESRGAKLEVQFAQTIGINVMEVAALLAQGKIKKLGKRS